MTDSITPPSDTPPPEESLLKFPCEFTIKVFGAMAPDYEQTIIDLIRPLAPNISSGAIQSRTSENGKYLSLSITLYVESREQLDNIYRALTGSPKVLMAL
jgi:putative lipoic acid-binding regulatory protein